MSFKRPSALLLILAVILVIVLLSGLFDYLTLNNLKQNAASLVKFSNEYYVESVIIFLLAHFVLTGFSIPGSSVLTIAGGLMFGTVGAALLVNAGATSGSTIAYLYSRYFAGDWIYEKYSDKLKRFRKEVDKYGSGYLLTLRLIPMSPFVLINIFAGLARIRLVTFIWTTSLGIVPGSVIFAYAGGQLDTIESVRDIFTPRVLAAWSLLAIFALVSTVIRHIVKKIDQRESSEEHLKGDSV